MLRFFRFLVVVILVSTALFTAPSARAQSSVQVWSGNMAGWFFYAFGSAPTPTFGYGPGTPPLGTGSFGIFAPAAVPINGGAAIGRGGFAGTPLNSLNISYRTYYSATSGDSWRVRLYINTAGGASAANCAVDYVHAGGPANQWLLRVPTSAAGSWSPSGGWVWRGDQVAGPCSPPVWGNPISWNAVILAYPSAVLAPNTSGVTVALEIYNSGTSNLNGVIDAVTVNGITWDFEVAPLFEPPAQFFDPGDGRYDPRPGDRIAAYCEANRLVVYGVNNQSRGFLLGNFGFEELKRAGEEGIYLDRGVDGIVSASMGPEGYIWVAWTGGQYNASGRAGHGFAKLVFCGKK